MQREGGRSNLPTFQGPIKYPLLSDLSPLHAVAPSLHLSLGRTDKRTRVEESTRTEVKSWPCRLLAVGISGKRHSLSGSQLPHSKNGSDTHPIWGYEKLKEKNVPEAQGSGVAPSQWSPHGSIFSSFIVFPSEFILPPLLDCEHFEGSNIY